MWVGRPLLCSSEMVVEVEEEAVVMVVVCDPLDTVM